MKISIVMGFFLPMPPDAGGATEKSWHRLSIELARLGHEVTIYSRRWAGWPDEERLEGVRHIRLKGYHHTRHLWRNLLLDFLWGLRIYRKLARADVTIVNSVLLPVWLGPLRRDCGRLVLMPGRTPKGQFRLYRKIDAILAVSTMMKEAILRENPRLAPQIDIVGYPIDWQVLAKAPLPTDDCYSGRPITLGYVGRIHREKGIELLVRACELLAKKEHLPKWRVVFCGPRDVAQGGSGETFAVEMERRLRRVLPDDTSRVLPPIFQADRLAQLYRDIDVFCYPSLAAHGETFGVAVAEAMAAGAVPVVSALPCFADYVKNGHNGFVFDHEGEEAPQRLAEILAQALRDHGRRRTMSALARTSVQRYDYPRYAAHLLESFEVLLGKRGESHE